MTSKLRQMLHMTMEKFSVGARDKGARTLMALLFALLSVCVPAPASASDARSVLTCDTLTHARPGQTGVTYRGHIINDDYHFDATIPAGLVGLGSADGAPFHGFALFINDSSCILFLIQQRLERPGESVSPRRPRGKAVNFGNRRGLSYATVGLANGKRYFNNTVLVALPRLEYVDDASLILVTPLEDRGATEPVFRKFLSSFTFR